tara:strand:- start:695 stop:1282 length:588 start_codon:yes stop_codon:yes gene_type:complete
MDQALLREFNEAIARVYEIANQSGVRNPLDKYKYREVQVAYLLGHTVFTGASGGKQETNDKFGADAIDQNGKLVEYKSKTLKQEDLVKLQEGTLSVSGIYNGAYTDESIRAYREIDHYYSVHYKGVVVAIAKVDTKYVCDTLQKNHEAREAANRILRAEGKKTKTTNCNSAPVVFTEDNPLIDIVYKNPVFFLEQ